MSGSKKMDANLLHLRTSVIEAVTILQKSHNPLDIRVDHANAVLRAALWHLGREQNEEPSATDVDPEVAVASERGDDEMEIIDSLHPTPRSLSDYRRDRGMRISAFTDWLGIPQHEYAHIIHRQPVDRRLRDHVAYKLGVEWRVIAEFMPKPPPEPYVRLVPIPAPEGTEPPPEPWYLLDEETGQVISGPHTEPIPENAGYLSHPLIGNPCNLVVLYDLSGYTEENQLPPDGYSAKERSWRYDDWDAGEDENTEEDNAIADHSRR